MEVSGTMQDFTAYVAAHPYVQAALIIVATIIFAKIVEPLFANIIQYFTRHTKTDIDDKLGEAMRKPIFYAVTLLGISFAASLLELPGFFGRFAPLVIQTLFVLVFAQAASRIAKVLLEGAVHVRRIKMVNEHTVSLFTSIAYIIVGAVALYAAFLIWGIDVTAWLASAGIIGIAIGFAAKDTLSNLISGIFIIADEPYKVGDFIVLDSGQMGTVSYIGLRTTRVKTFESAEVIIPNAVIANSTVTNKSSGPSNARGSVNIGVAYGTDIKKVEEVLLDIARAHELVLDDPEPIVRFIEFADSSLNFSLFFWVADPLTAAGTTNDINYAVYERFSKEGIEIPFPQRDVHLKKGDT
ncbi:MAG: mechanosensitive ion channel [bacterium]|nr:mechanosensitive ion channel [bacterium]